MSAKLIRFSLAAAFAAGCASTESRPQDHLAERICSPGVSTADSSRATPSKPELANNGAPQAESVSEHASQTVIPASATVSAQPGTSEPPVESTRDGSAA